MIRLISPLKTWCALILSFLIQLLSSVVLFNGKMAYLYQIAFHAVIGALTGVMVLVSGFHTILKVEDSRVQTLFQLPFFDSKEKLLTNYYYQCQCSDALFHASNATKVPVSRLSALLKLAALEFFTSYFL